MIETSVDAQASPKQGLLGEFIPASGVSLTLHRRDSKLLLLRHRVNTYASAADIAARIDRSDEAVIVVWDEWHQKHRPVWMGTVEDWISDLLKDES